MDGVLTGFCHRSLILPSVEAGQATCGPRDPALARRPPVWTM